VPVRVQYQLFEDEMKQEFHEHVKLLSPDTNQHLPTQHHFTEIFAYTSPHHLQHVCPEKGWTLTHHGLRLAPHSHLISTKGLDVILHPPHTLDLLQKMVKQSILW